MTYKINESDVPPSSYGDETEGGGEGGGINSPRQQPAETV